MLVSPGQAGTSVRSRFGSPLSSKVLVCGQSCDFASHNEGNIKTALIAAHLNAGVILVVLLLQMLLYVHRDHKAH